MPFSPTPFRKTMSGQRAAIRFERKTGRPITGQVLGLEKEDLRYATVTIMYPGPETEDRNGRRSRMYTTFDVLPIAADGRFTTDPIPPGHYTLHLFAVRSSTPDQSTQSSDFAAQKSFTVPQEGDMPKLVVTATAEPDRGR